MNEKFKSAIDDLHSKFELLVAMSPCTVEQLPATDNMPIAGVYLFSEGDTDLYVGRSDTIRSRLQSHCRPSSDHHSATFAYRLATEITRIKPIKYSPDSSRDKVQVLPEFAPVFVEQKARIRKMDVRFVSEPAPLKQALLEMYAAISLETPHNNFDNH